MQLVASGVRGQFYLRIRHLVGASCSSGCPHTHEYTDSTNCTGWVRRRRRRNRRKKRRKRGKKRGKEEAGEGKEREKDEREEKT